MYIATRHPATAATAHPPLRENAETVATQYVVATVAADTHTIPELARAHRVLPISGDTHPSHHVAYMWPRRTTQAHPHSPHSACPAPVVGAPPSSGSLRAHHM